MPDLNYWLEDGTGRNMLKGVYGDPNNPVLLTNDFIVWALQHSQEARDSFFAILPSLLPEERARYEELLEDYPNELKLIQDEQIWHDNAQRRDNTMGIYTTGPRGGGN